MDVEIVDTGSKRDSRGRRIEGGEERERLLEAYDVSGLTQKAFAEREGIAYSTFVSWLKQRRQRSRADTCQEAAPSFHEFSLPMGSSSALEVCFPDGMVIRGSDADSLVSLVKALRC